MSREGSLIHTPPGVLPLTRDLLWPANFLVLPRPPCAEGQRGALASVRSPTLAVMATPPWSWQARVFRRWKEPMCAVLPPSRYAVAGCQCPQEDKKCPDRQLSLYHRGWAAFVCRSQQRGKERNPALPGLAGKALCSLTPLTSPGKSHTCLITLTLPTLPSGLSLIYA